jgi:hypothetical protein
VKPEILPARFRDGATESAKDTKYLDFSSLMSFIPDVTMNVRRKPDDKF